MLNCATGELCLNTGAICRITNEHDLDYAYTVGMGGKRIMVKKPVIKLEGWYNDNNLVELRDFYENSLNYGTSPFKIDAFYYGVGFPILVRFVSDLVAVCESSGFWKVFFELELLTNSDTIIARIESGDDSFPCYDGTVGGDSDICSIESDSGEDPCP